MRTIASKFANPISVSAFASFAAFDAHRVASGAGIEEGHVIDPMVELVLTKGVELFAEAIPGCIIQFYSLFLAPDRVRKRVLASIFMSAFSAGFTSASVSYE
jgi:hypothetical protein